MAVFFLKKCFQYLIIFVVADSDVRYNPPLRKSAKRYAQAQSHFPEFKNSAQQIDLVDLLYGNTKLSPINV